LTYLNIFKKIYIIDAEGAIMANSKLDSKFFESTRGRIVLLLRNTQKTVNELADALEISDNAVRAHLTVLERDGLVAQSGTIKGFRKPHYSYTLTDEARHLFPKAYDSLLNRLLDQLHLRMSAATLKEVLSDVGRSIGIGAKIDGTAFDGKLEAAIDMLGELGGAAVVERTDNKIIIKSESCPFADAVKEHPNVCKVAESMLSEIIETSVTEHCDHGKTPKCRFEIMDNCEW
jgi:predicted ArsR family transcriptional regulator